MKKILVLIFALLLLVPIPALATEKNDLIQINKDIIVDSNEVVTGDIIAIMGDIRVDGKVTGDVVAILGDIRVNGEVTGDVTAVGGRVIRGETSKIYGKTTEVKISGVRNMVNDITRQNTNRRYIWFKIVRFLGLLAVGILAILLFPNSIKMASGVVEKEVGRKMLIGLAILLLTPVMLLLLLITLIGIPLIPILLLLLYAAGFFGYLCISIVIGRKLNEHLKMKTEILLEFALGALLLWLINSVPFIGSLTSAIVLITSLGITAETRFGTKRSIE